MSSLPLVDEIESPIRDVQSPADVHAAITRKYIRESSYWPRIRAALRSADLMANRIRNDYEPGHPAWAEMERFRAATEGTK